MKITLLQGDVLKALATLPDESIDCCITSPPYWGLRDYGTATWEGGDPSCNHARLGKSKNANTGQANEGAISGDGIYKDICAKCGAKRIDKQLGLEKTPEEYVAKMVEVFREVRRVLKKEGTCWLNLGDTYAGSGCGTNDYRTPASLSLSKTELYDGPRPQNKVPTGLKPKDLCGIPWRVAFALQADGWWLRQDIIWQKPNPIPESVTDRCTKSHEYVFILTKSLKYYFDNEAIREPYKMNRWGGKHKTNENVKVAPGIKEAGGQGALNRMNYDCYPNSGRNKRSVWTITTKPFKGAHFATFPEDLIEPMVKAGTSEKGICYDCGKSYVRILEKKAGTMNIRVRDAKKGILDKKSGFDESATEKEIANYGKEIEGYTKTIGWRPSCNCNKDSIPAVVLDPFMGSGTTGVVAPQV